MNKTSIPWADYTWNPITGCTRGCSYCYARGIAQRFGDMRHAEQWASDVAEFGPCFTAEANNPEASSTFPVGFAPTTYPHRLDEPLRLKKPSVIFLGSMGDLFDPAFSDDFRDRIVKVIFEAKQHTFMLLTKQPSEMFRHMTDFGPGVDYHDVKPLQNLWLGVTVTNQADADERIPLLLDTPAAHRFVSVEPMQGPVDLRSYLPTFPGVGINTPDLVIAGAKTPGKALHEQVLYEWCPRTPDNAPCFGTGEPDNTCAKGCFNMLVPAEGIDAAGIDALRSLRDQCLAAGVPFHYKHGGTNPALDGVVYDWKPGS